MNVVVVIQGHEAIPVRAIPLITHWEDMFPDKLAHVLAGSRFAREFRNLCAYENKGAETTKINPNWWLNHSVPEFEALMSSIENQQLPEPVAYEKWKFEALKKIPPGIFVWKLDFVSMYDKYRIRTGNTELDLAPFMRDAETQRLVMEGFEGLQFEARAQGAPAGDAPESKEQRQDNRLKMCEDAGLKMDKRALSRLPDGVGNVAALEGVTRQAFTDDVKAALMRREAATTAGIAIRRA